MDVPFWVWAITIAAIVGMLLFDFVGHVRTPHAPSLREAATWSAVYVGIAVVFGILVFVFAGAQYGGEYFAGYITEKSLSVDNLFVFVLIMASFGVPRELQQKVLLFGITFALISRTLFILLGAAVIAAWSDVFYLFGLFLLIIAGGQLKGEMSGDAEGAQDEADNVMVRLVKRFLPASEQFDGDRLFTTVDGKRLMTPMLLVMIAIGATDILFAFDSIPAIFGVTQEAYIVFTATAFSLMGLRQLYFLIDGLLDRLVYLAYGLSALLAFIGVKLILHALHENNLPFINGGENVPVVEIPTTLSLVVVVVILAITVAISLASPKGQALRALQNAEKYSYRYSKLAEDADPAERERAAALMDRWTARAEALDQRWRDQLLEHKDAWSAIIRTAHETRLADPRDDDARGVSEQIVRQDGPTV